MTLPNIWTIPMKTLILFVNKKNLEDSEVEQEELFEEINDNL